VSEVRTRRIVGALGAASAALVLAGCSQVAAIAPVGGDRLAEVRYAGTDVLLEEGIEILAAPVCTSPDEIAVTCEGETMDGEVILLAVTAASALPLALQLAATAWAARRIVAPDARTHAGLALAWAAVLVLIGAVLSALVAPAGLLAAVAATFVLPAAAAGRAGALSSSSVLRRHPWRALLLMLGVVIAWLLLWGTRLAVRASAARPTLAG